VSTPEVREVVGSTGNVYRVTSIDGADQSCTCPQFVYRGPCKHMSSAAVQPQPLRLGSAGYGPAYHARRRELAREHAVQRTQAQKYAARRAAWDAAQQRAKQVRKMRAASVVGNELRVTFPQLAVMASDLAKVGRGLRTVGRWASRHDAQYREARAARAEQKEAAWKAAPTGQVKHEGR
jgi:hypothetical protein